MIDNYQLRCKWRELEKVCHDQGIGVFEKLGQTLTKMNEFPLEQGWYVKAHGEIKWEFVKSKT